MKVINFSDEDDDLSRDEKFLNDLQIIIESNLVNERFGVNELAGAMGISRIQVYRKLRRIAGKNISQYIKEYRLERAMQLLKKDVANVSEVSYKVGFGSPAYFIKCFREYYGFSPGEILKKESEGERFISDPFKDDRNDTGTDNKPESLSFRNFFNQYTRPIRYAMIILAFLLAASTVAFIIQNIPDPNNNVSENTVLVIPFQNNSPDPENEYFCRGMQETILNYLWKIKGLVVKSGTGYDLTEKSIDEIRNDLDAASIFTGIIQKIGNRFSLNVKLVDTRTGKVLWSEMFQEEYNEKVFAIQNKIAQQVASALQVVITSEDEKGFKSQIPTDIQAYDYYIRGLYEQEKFWRDNNPKYLVESHKLLDRSLAIDPDYEPAIRCKGTAYLGQRKFDSAMVYSDKILRINPVSADGYALRGACFREKLIPDSAIENYEKAIEFSRDYEKTMDYQFNLGWIYSFAKKNYRKGLPLISKGFVRSGDKTGVQAYLIGVLFVDIGDYEYADKYYKMMFGNFSGCKAINDYADHLMRQTQFREAIEFLDTICPGQACIPNCNNKKFYAYIILKEYNMAEEFFDRYVNTGGMPNSWDSLWLAFSYIKNGKAGTGTAILKHIKKELEEKLLINNKNMGLALSLSCINAIQGNKKESLGYLSDFFDVSIGYGFHDFPLICPAFNDMRDDPVFRAIVKHVQDSVAVRRAIVRKMIESGEIDL